jgi:hypothetical protein
MATARELWEASMALRERVYDQGHLPIATACAMMPIMAHSPQPIYPRKSLVELAFEEVSPVYLAFFGSHQPRDTTIARSRASLLRWRAACHRARKGLADTRLRSAAMSRRGFPLRPSPHPLAGS